MKITNYDSDFSGITGYKQGHPSMPDVFRMLVYRRSNSAPHDLFLKNLHQNKYQALLRDFASNIETLMLVTRSLKRLEMKLSHSKNSSLTTKKIAVFDDLVCESNQNSIINYFINGQHRNCSFTYLTQTFYKVPKNIRENCSHFCVFSFLPRENKRIADELGVDHRLLDRATDKKYSFFYYDKPQKSVKKNFDEDI